MADSAVQPNPIDTSSIPLIRGSTYDILCFLGGKIDKRVIKLDSMAASARNQLSTAATLGEKRDAIDAGIAKFTPENFKTFGVTYKQRNTELTNDMTQLSEAYEKLLQEYKHLKEQHQKIRARKEDKGPSQADIEQLNKETTQFINTAKNYDNKYRSLKHELNGLYDLVSKLAPGSENKDSGPTPTLR